MLLVASAFAALTGCKGTEPTAEETLYVGTYGKSIHILSYNPETAQISAKGNIPADNASYIALANGGRTIYAVSEQGESSGVNSFEGEALEWRQTGHCDEIGDDPCYILPIAGTDLVATADYTGGSFSVFATNNGSVKTRAQGVHFDSRYEAGACPVPGRQDDAHIHQVREIPAEMCKAAGIEGRYFLISDLGNDMIRVTRLEGAALEQISAIECGPGAGPRHMEFNVAAGMLYCITELSGEVLAWKMSAEDGMPAFEEVQRLVADQFNAGGSADIHLHPSGKWLYTSHRLSGDGISVFDVKADGTLEKISYTATGSHPRNFTFSPDGARLLVACRDTNGIEVYDIHEDGTLSDKVSEYILSEDQPVCLLFAND